MVTLNCDDTASFSIRLEIRLCRFSPFIGRPATLFFWLRYQSNKIHPKYNLAPRCQKWQQTNTHQDATASPNVNGAHADTKRSQPTMNKRARSRKTFGRARPPIFKDRPPHANTYPCSKPLVKCSGVKTHAENKLDAQTHAHTNTNYSRQCRNR